MEGSQTEECAFIGVSAGKPHTDRWRITRYKIRDRSRTRMVHHFVKIMMSGFLLRLSRLPAQYLNHEAKKWSLVSRIQSPELCWWRS